MAVQYKAQVGTALRARRKELGISQAAVADRVEDWLREHKGRPPGKPFTAQNISRWERGANMGTSDNLEAVAAALETTVAEIMGAIRPEGTKLAVLEGDRRKDDDLREEIAQLREDVAWLRDAWRQELSPFLADQAVQRLAPTDEASAQETKPKSRTTRPRRAPRRSG